MCSSGSLQVDYIRPATWNKKAFERLVLRPDKKKLIEALVKIHLDNNHATDVIEGKGAGLIILLHGPPGTGKTLTAETVSELARKPLYRVTCGDIGTDAEGIEKYLESALYLGTIWDSVVLLDEADVFLEERTQNDLARNALVSVFLRVLEYFNGIMILTSNRVGRFDEAFKSRMQLAILYPTLNEKDRSVIWENFFDALHDAGADMEFEDLSAKSTVRRLARKELNGRQIRNSIKTARQLAAHDGVTFGIQQLESAILVAEEFENYLVKTRGKDGDLAQALMIRNDEIEGAQP